VAATEPTDIIQVATPLAEFYRLSMAAIGALALREGVLTAQQANALVDRPTISGFLGCGFVHIGGLGTPTPKIRSNDLKVRDRTSRITGIDQ
jgi:hypothetical protein